MKRIKAMQDEVCKEQGCKPCPYCNAMDCGACLAGTVGPALTLINDSGSSHVNSCERDWIG